MQPIESTECGTEGTLIKHTREILVPSQHKSQHRRKASNYTGQKLPEDKGCRAVTSLGQTCSTEQQQTHSSKNHKQVSTWTHAAELARHAGQGAETQTTMRHDADLPKDATHHSFTSCPSRSHPIRHIHHILAQQRAGTEYRAQAANNRKTRQQERKLSSLLPANNRLSCALQYMCDCLAHKPHYCTQCRWSCYAMCRHVRNIVTQ